ncbi:cell division protein [Rhodobacteraceae bacterium HIMB11]|nr:cell division protein [Rhodobacteraceae bacterium HIMB11]
MLITKQKTGTKWAACGILIALLAGCAGLDLGEDTSSDAPSTVTNLVERDVEAPDVVNISEAGLWDGRPSLGGIWVAHPDAKDPEKVIIRNPQNGKFVIGALFGREREFSGPSLQLSSDAAEALGILAGQPTNVSVVALRRQSIPVETPEAVKAENQVIEESLDPIQQTAEAAIAAADTTTPKPKPSSLRKPYLQIGIFGVEENARSAVSSISAKGLSASMSKLTLNNKPFWRVIAGPAATTAELSAMLKTVTDAGFADAYAVKN